MAKEEEKDIKTSDTTRDHQHKSNSQWPKAEWINFWNNGSQREKGNYSKIYPKMEGSGNYLGNTTTINYTKFK